MSILFLGAIYLFLLFLCKALCIKDVVKIKFIFIIIIIIIIIVFPPLLLAFGVAEPLQSQNCYSFIRTNRYIPLPPQ